MCLCVCIYLSSSSACSLDRIQISLSLVPRIDPKVYERSVKRHPSRTMTPWLKSAHQDIIFFFSPSFFIYIYILPRPIESVPHAEITKDLIFLWRYYIYPGCLWDKSIGIILYIILSIWYMQKINKILSLLLLFNYLLFYFLFKILNRILF